MFCFPKTNPNIQKFRTSAFTSVQSCKVVCLLIRPFVSIRTLTRLQIIQIAVENQFKKKAHGSPLRILDLPFQHI